MVNKMIRYCIAVFMFGVFSLQAETQHRVIADYSFSDDTDNTQANKYFLGYERLFTQGEYAGILSGVRKYHGEDSIIKNNRFDEIKLVGRKNISAQTYLHGNISLLNGDGWSPELYNLTLVHALNTKWRIEGDLDKDILGTSSAIAKHYMIESYGVTADYSISEQHVLVAGLYQQSISDNNSREGRLLQYIHKPDWFENGYFKLRAKQRSSDFNPPEYFSPDDLKQYHVLVGYETLIDQERNLKFRIELGKGRQHIDGVSESAEEYLVGLHGWLMSTAYMDAQYGCTSDGGEDSYKYCHGRLVFNYLW